MTPLVADNQIQDSRNGVVVTEKARPTLQGNQITNNNEYGLVVIGEAQPKVGNNDLQNNGFQE
ncbi:MAG: right-handed parallel beta-helix repeat-containing protein, partial [Chroococcidiopsis sp.]